MLGHPHALEAVPLREVDFPQRLLDDLAVRRGAPAREELEDADVHHDYISAVRPSSASLSTVFQFRAVFVTPIHLSNFSAILHVPNPFGVCT